MKRSYFNKTFAVLATLGLVLVVGVPADAAPTLILDLKDAQIDNNIARLTLEGEFIPENAGEVVQSLQVGLKLPDTNAALSSISFVPAPPFEFPPTSPSSGFDPLDGPDANAFMSIDDLFNDGLGAGTHTLGEIRVNLNAAGIAVGDPLTIDISRLGISTGTSGLFRNLNNLQIFDFYDIAFVDIGNNQDPADDGRRTFIVPPRDDVDVPEPTTMSLLIIASLLSVRRRLSFH